MFSLNAIYNENAFINFDAIQCISKMQEEEVDELNNLKKLKLLNQNICSLIRM